MKFEVFGCNLLIVDRLEILPRYRGQCIGIIIMRKLIQRFSPGGAVVAIKPFPLQFESELIGRGETAVAQRTAALSVYGERRERD